VQVINTFGDLNRVIYYHGSTKKLEYLEALENQKPLPFILMPDSKILSVWNIVMMLLLLYTATYIPFKTAFIEDSSELVNTIEFSIDSLFFVDLVVNFISAYETTYKNIEFRFTMIAFTYVRSWFLFDLVSCIPFQYLDFSSDEGLGNAVVDNGMVDEEEAVRLLTSVNGYGGRFLHMITRHAGFSQNRMRQLA
jgi:Ion transport protein